VDFAVAERPLSTLAYVADGRYEGFWELYLSPWDLAAGALLSRKREGESPTDGEETDGKDGSSIVASNGHLHDDILRHFESGLSRRAMSCMRRQD